MERSGEEGERRKEGMEGGERLRPWVAKCKDRAAVQMGQACVRRHCHEGALQSVT